MSCVAGNKKDEKDDKNSGGGGSKYSGSAKHGKKNDSGDYFGLDVIVEPNFHNRRVRVRYIVRRTRIPPAPTTRDGLALNPVHTVIPDETNRHHL